MIRLKPEDFEDAHELAKYAATAGISLEEFREQFGKLVGDAQKKPEEKK
jgi:6-phosphofructokinase 1